MDMIECVAKRIRERRKLQRLTQPEFAERVGVSLMTVKRWEDAKIGRTPNVSVMPKLAEVLNTSVTYLMGLDDNAAPIPSVEPTSTADRTTRRETKLEASGRLIFEWGDNNRLDLPDTPENRVMFQELVAKAMKGGMPNVNVN